MTAIFDWRGLSDLQYDLRVMEIIPEKLQKGEASLYATKWWDYRFLHPMAATYLFADIYEECFRRVYRRAVDMKEADSVKVFNTADKMRDTEKKVVGLWHARRTADAAGIPYKFFCLTAIDWSERYAWKTLARPEELTNTILLDKVAEAWVAQHKMRLNLPDESFIMQPGFYKDSFQRYLCDQLTGRPGWQFSLRSMLSRKYLDEQFARLVLGSTRVEQALAAA